MKIDFILTVRALLSNLWDTSRQAGGCPKSLLAVLYRAGFNSFGATKQASADLRKHVSLGG
jgi:hypothetical protein